MNERLHAPAPRLPDAERRRDRGAFFKSLHGTLNHPMVGDRLWPMHGLSQGLAAALPPELRLADDRPRLDVELCPDFDALHAARARADALLVDRVAGLDKPALLRDSVETRDDGTLLREPLWIQLQHLFHHPAQHRGRATMPLMQTGIDPGTTDILAMPAS